MRNKLLMDQFRSKLEKLKMTRTSTTLNATE